VNKSTVRAITLGKRPRRGRPKVLPDETQRAHIVDAARGLLVKKGYGSTTTSDVAAAARVSKQTLYRLFPSKAALFAAVIETHRQSMLALPGDYEDMSLERAIELIFKVNINQRAHQERLGLIRILLAEAQQSPELLRIARLHGADPSRNELAKWLAEQHERGRIVIDDPDTAAGVLLDITIGSVVLRMNIGRKAPSLHEYEDHVRRCVAIFLNGVLPR
jgi:TetR/AcrR family transcriptional repressor of mexJK operon